MSTIRQVNVNGQQKQMSNSKESPKIDPSDPRVRKLVYSMYRDMLSSRNDEANDFIGQKDASLVHHDLGVGPIIESIILRQGSQGGGSNPSTPTPQTSSSPSIPPPPPPPSSGGSIPPPPPPLMSNTIPAVRLSSEIGPRDKGPPMALAGAMMKDKKPFTYTPGGLDLSEIRSPRMAKRLQMNATAEGVSSQPAPTANFPSGSSQSGQQAPPPYLPPAAMAAMNPAMQIPVLPPGGFNPGNLNRTHKPSDFVRQEHYQQQQNQPSIPQQPFLPQQLQQQIQQHQLQRQQQQQNQYDQYQNAAGRSKSPLPPPPPPPERSSSNVVPIQLMNNVSGQGTNNYLSSNNSNFNNADQQQSGTGSIYIPPLSSNTNLSSGNVRGSSPSPSFSPSVSQPQQQQQQQQARPTHQTKAQAHSQNLGSIYIPPVEQRPSVFSERGNNNNTGGTSSPSTAASTPVTPQTPQLNKAPTPWMNSYNRMQSQQGSNSPPWGTSLAGARTIPIAIAREGDDDINSNSSLQQQQQYQQNQPNYYPQQQIPPWQQQQQQQQFPSGFRVVPIQIEKNDGRNTPITSSGSRNIPIQIEGSGNVRRVQSSGNQTPSTPGRQTPGFLPSSYANPMSGHSATNAKDAFAKQAAELSAGVEKMTAGDEGYRTEPIQSKSFRVIQKIADDDNRLAEEQRKLELTDDDKILMDNIKAQVDEGSSLHQTAEPRFRGGHIPSRSFRTLQSSLPQSPDSGSQQDFTPSYPTQQTSSGQSTTHNIPIRMVSITPPSQQQQTSSIPDYGSSQQYNRVPASQQQTSEPKKYMGSNIPSRSFKILQAMTTNADDETSAAMGSESEAGADKTPRQSPIPHVKHRINLASRPPRPPCRSLSSTPTPTSSQNQANNPQNFVRSRTVSPSPTPKSNTCNCNCKHSNNNNGSSYYNNYNSYYGNGYNNTNSQSESESEDYVAQTPRSYSPWPENFDPNFDPYAYMQYYYWWYYNYGYPMGYPNNVNTNGYDNSQVMQNQNYYSDPYQQQQIQDYEQYQQQQQQTDGNGSNGYYNGNNSYDDYGNEVNNVPTIVIDKSRESPQGGGGGKGIQQAGQEEEEERRQQTSMVHNNGSNSYNNSYHQHPTSESEEFTTGEWTETEPENEIDECPTNNISDSNSKNHKVSTDNFLVDNPNLKESVVSSCDSDYFENDDKIMEKQKSVLFNGNEESEFESDLVGSVKNNIGGNSYSHSNSLSNEISTTGDSVGLNVNVINDSNQETVPLPIYNSRNNEVTHHTGNSNISHVDKNENNNILPTHSNQDRFETYIEDDEDDETDDEEKYIRASRVGNEEEEEENVKMTASIFSNNNNNNNKNKDNNNTDDDSISTNSGIVIEEPETPSLSEEDASTLVNESDALYSRGVVIEECYSQSSETEDEYDMELDLCGGGDVSSENKETTVVNSNNNNNNGHSIPHHRLSTIQEVSERSGRTSTITIPAYGDDEDTMAEDISEDEDTTDDGSSVSVIENKSDDWGAMAAKDLNTGMNGSGSTSSSDAEDGNDEDPLLPTTVTTAQLPLTLSFSKSRSFRDITTVFVGDSQVERKSSIISLDDYYDDDANEDEKYPPTVTSANTTTTASTLGSNYEKEEDDKQELRTFNTTDCVEVTGDDDEEYSTGPVGLVEEVETEAEFSIVENHVDEHEYDEDEPVVSFTISLSRSTSKSIGKKCEDDSESGEDLEVDQDVVLNISPSTGYSFVQNDAEDEVMVEEKEGTEVDFWGEIQQSQTTKEPSPQVENTNSSDINNDDTWSYRSNSSYYGGGNHDDENEEMDNWNSSARKDSWMSEDPDNELHQIMSNDDDDDDHLWDRFNSYDKRQEIISTIPRMRRISDEEEEEEEKKEDVKQENIIDNEKKDEFPTAEETRTQELTAEIDEGPDFWGEIQSRDDTNDNNCEDKNKKDETVNFWDRTPSFEVKRLNRQFSWEFSCDEDDGEKNQSEDTSIPQANSQPLKSKEGERDEINNLSHDTAASIKSATVRLKSNERKESITAIDDKENICKKENVKVKSESIEILENSKPGFREEIQIQSDELTRKSKTKEIFDGFSRSTETRSLEDQFRFKEIKQEIFDNVEYHGGKSDETKSSTSKSRGKTKEEISSSSTTTTTTVKSSKKEIENTSSTIDTIFSNRKLDNCEFNIQKRTHAPPPSSLPTTPLSNGHSKRSGKNKESSSPRQSTLMHNKSLLNGGYSSAYLSADENSDESTCTTVPEHLHVNRNSDASIESECPNNYSGADHHENDIQVDSLNTQANDASAHQENSPQKPSSPVYELKRTTSLTKKEVNERNVEIKETRERFKLSPNSNHTSLDSDGHQIETLNNGNGMSVSPSSSDCPNGGERMNRAEDLLWRIERFLQESLSLGSEDDSGVMTDISRQISDVDTDNDIDADVVPLRNKNKNCNGSSTSNISSTQGLNNSNSNKMNSRSLKTRSLIETSSSTLESTFETTDKTITTANSSSSNSNGVVMRNMSNEKKSLRYQRAKTHSRLFQLLQDECTREEVTLEEEMIDFENLEQVEAAIEKSNNKKGVSSLKDNVISSTTDEMQENGGNSRLVPLPIKNFLASSSVDSTSSSSGVLSPSSPVSRDKILVDIIQEFQFRHQNQTKRKVSNFPSKIFALLQAEFGEEFYDCFDCTEDDFDFPLVNAQELLPTSIQDSDASGKTNSSEQRERHKESKGKSSKDTSNNATVTNGFYSSNSTSFKNVNDPLNDDETQQQTNDNIDYTAASNKKIEFLEVPPRRKKSTATRDFRFPKNKKSNAV